MAEETRKPVWQMVREAVSALGVTTTNVAVRDWVLSRYPGTNRSTISVAIIASTVNHPTRVYYHPNQKPRLCNTVHDFLFRTARGWLELYDPSKHGNWQIVERDDGSLAPALVRGQAEVQRPTAETQTEESRGRFAAEDQLRDYLATHLDAIEKGLELYVNQEGDTGVEYPTPLGRIDLLCQDAQGGLVVVEPKVGRPADAVCGRLLRYMGWVKAHLAEDRPARGIIIARHVSDSLRYAVADLQGVSLKEYAMHVTLRDVAGLEGNQTEPA